MGRSRCRPQWTPTGTVIFHKSVLVARRFRGALRRLLRCNGRWVGATMDGEKDHTGGQGDAGTRRILSAHDAVKDLAHRSE